MYLDVVSISSVQDCSFIKSIRKFLRYELSKITSQTLYMHCARALCIKPASWYLFGFFEYSLTDIQDHPRSQEVNQGHMELCKQLDWFRTSCMVLCTGDIDIAILSVCLSVRNVPVSDENGLTCNSFFTIRLRYPNHSSFIGIKHVH